jgi:tRNA(fMet)-specific endonuclease VapC
MVLEYPGYPDPSLDLHGSHIHGKMGQHELKAAGTPIPTNDLWIAALARQHQLRIVTRDAHFRAVRGLGMVAW